MTSVVPSNFPSIIKDLVTDLSVTFPEYSSLWSMYSSETTEEAWIDLYNYCLGVYPERFFDILYQNMDIFTNAEVNTLFLPDVEFKYLFLCEGITENTQKSLWKYIQLILFTVIGSMKDKTEFGKSMNLFEGIGEEELQSKLKEAMESMADFFQKVDPKESVFEPKSEVPNPEDIHAHLKQLFGEKLGSMATELIDELTDDLKDVFGLDPKNLPENLSPGDLFKTLMKHPDKFMKIMQKVSSKFQQKMKEGDLSQEDVMREASEIFQKMKGMGNAKEMQEMFQNMTKSMGGMDTNMYTNMFKFKEKPKKKTFHLEPSATPNQFTYKEGMPLLKSVIKQEMTDEELTALAREIEMPTKKKDKKKKT